METKVKILILEHDPNDLFLLQYELKKSGLDYITEVVQTKESYENALKRFCPDIILSDFSLPSFDGVSAFKIRQQIKPETPFIIVSGTIGEENAVDLIKQGVTDYALKDKMYQIIPKIERALNESADRKQKEIAEMQLRQREEHLQKIMDLSLDLIFTLNKDKQFATINPASKLLLGYDQEELIGKELIEFVHEEDKERTAAAIANLDRGVDIINFENRFVRKYGSVITMLWSARWDYDDELGYSVAKDITHIIKAEEKIKFNERRFRTLLQNSTDGLALLAADGNVIERSPAAIKILGLDEKEVSSRFRTDLVYPEDLPLINQTCVDVKKDPNKILTVAFRLKRPDGELRWIETTFHNQLQEPAVGAIVLNFRDITEKKLAELAVKKSETKYRSLFHASPIPMWVYDVNTYRFLDVNKAAIRHYGYSREEFLSMTLHDIRPKEDIEEMERSVKHAVENGGFSKTVSRHVKKNGELISVDVQGNSIELNENIARVVLAIDISERLKYIKTMEEQNAKLREIAWTQSHIVRAPVARIMGLASLPKTCGPERVNNSEILHYILNSAHELDGIIREIVRKTEEVKDDPIFE